MYNLRKKACSNNIYTILNDYPFYLFPALSETDAFICKCIMNAFKLLINSVFIFSMNIAFVTIKSLSILSHQFTPRVQQHTVYNKLLICIYVTFLTFTDVVRKYQPRDNAGTYYICTRTVTYSEYVTATLQVYFDRETQTVSVVSGDVAVGYAKHFFPAVWNLILITSLC